MAVCAGTHAIYVFYATQGIMQKLSNEQSANIIYKFVRLRISYSKAIFSYIGKVIGCPHI